MDNNVKEIEKALEGSLRLAFEEYKNCIYSSDAMESLIKKFDAIIKEYNDIFHEYINGEFYYKCEYDKKNAEFNVDVNIKKIVFLAEENKQL